MIDSNGYLKMIDFGTAKVLTDYTSTVIGTPHYIPPEILQGKGYSLSCDFWSVGVCIYEIFYGAYPFGNYVTEVIEIYKEILNKKFFNLSKNPHYTEINNLIKGLLNKKVNERLCNMNSIKQNDFFKDLNWNELIDFKITPPYIPTNKEVNFKNEKNEKYEDFMMKNNPDENYENYDYDDIPVDYDKNWVDEF
jgi:cGMP-dependent protein kinase